MLVVRLSKLVQYINLNLLHFIRISVSTDVTGLKVLMSSALEIIHTP